MKSFLFCLVFILHAAPSSAQFTTQFSVPVDVDGTLTVLPTEAVIQPKRLLSYNIDLQVKLENLVHVLEMQAARELPDDARFRGLELRPLGDGGLSVKVLLRLSCFRSNASVSVRLKPIVAKRSVSLSSSDPQINISNDFCRLAADAIGVTSGIQSDIELAIREALSEPLWLDDLPTPYSSLPLSLASVRFLGADKDLVAKVEGYLGNREVD